MEKKPRTALKPLTISCTSSDCANGLHCFLRATSRPMSLVQKPGRNLKYLGALLSIESFDKFDSEWPDSGIVIAVQGRVQNTFIDSATWTTDYL